VIVDRYVMSSLSHRAPPVGKETKKLRTAIDEMKSEEEMSDGDGLRALFLCRDKRTVHKVAMIASSVWCNEMSDVLPELFYGVLQECVNGDINHCVFTVLLMILVSKAVRAEFSQSPFSGYLLEQAKIAYYKMFMGLTEDGSFCINSDSRICHGIIEYIMYVRIRCLSI
jgi:hypothetical protein